MAERSRRGERVTAHERQLVELVDAGTLDVSAAQWLSIAQRIGIDNLAVVLDEFAGEKIHVPAREHFFATLRRTLRTASIIRDLNRGISAKDVAVAYGVSVRHVRRLRTRADARSAFLG